MEASIQQKNTFDAPVDVMTQESVVESHTPADYTTEEPIISLPDTEPFCVDHIEMQLQEEEEERDHTACDMTPPDSDDPIHGLTADQLQERLTDMSDFSAAEDSEIHKDVAETINSSADEIDENDLTNGNIDLNSSIGDGLDSSDEVLSVDIESHDQPGIESSPTEPVESAPLEPTESVDFAPLEPTEPVESEQLDSEPLEPTELVDFAPLEPVEPFGSAPLEPTEPFDSAPLEPTEPVESEQLDSEPLEPTEHFESEPLEPTEPGDSEPLEPTEPLDSAPVEPIESEQLDSEPLEPTEHFEYDPLEPTESVDFAPLEPTEPFDSAPVEPVESEQLDSEPLEPTEHFESEPLEPTEPVESEQLDSEQLDSEPLEPTEYFESEPLEPTESVDFAPLEPTEPVESVGSTEDLIVEGVRRDLDPMMMSMYVGNDEGLSTEPPHKELERLVQASVPVAEVDNSIVVPDVKNEMILDETNPEPVSDFPLELKAEPVLEQQTGTILVNEPGEDLEHEQKEALEEPEVHEQPADAIEELQQVPSPEETSDGMMELHQLDDIDQDSLSGRDASPTLSGVDNVLTDNLMQVDGQLDNFSIKEESIPVKSADRFAMVDGPLEKSVPAVNPFLGVSPDGDEYQNNFSIPQYNVQDSAQPHLDDTSSMHEEFDPLKCWGQPMDLPAPPPPTVDLQAGTTRTKHATRKMNGTTKTSATKKDTKKTIPPTKTATTVKKTTTTTTKTTLKKEINGHAKPSATKSRPSTAPENKSAPPKRTGPASATKNRSVGACTSTATLAPVVPFYVDLTYIPAHGDDQYSTIDFFRRVRARYYVLSALNPSVTVLNALLEGRSTWTANDMESEVTLIPTYDTLTLRRWMADNRDCLAELRITVAPSASRCSIQLQDHEVRCAAYRLEF